MKYAPITNYTFNRRIKKEDDPEGFAILFALSEAPGVSDSPEQSLSEMLTHPALNWNPQETPSFQVYGCPVCKEVYFKKEMAENCANPEREFARKFEGLKVGDWLKFHKSEEHPLESWVSSAVGGTDNTVQLVQVTALSFCYEGFRCGKILTIHFNGGFLNASDAQWLSYWSRATEEDLNAFQRQTHP